MVTIFRILLFTGIFHSGVRSEAQAIYSDPKVPSEYISDDSSKPARVPFYKMLGRMDAIHQEVQAKEKALASLPLLQNTTQFNAYGYHSDYLPISSSGETPQEPRWSLEFQTLRKDGKLDLVLVPSVSPQGTELKGYGFPKRFSVVSADPDSPTEVYVDWTQADFPDPGRRPVYFHLPESNTRRVRLEVFAGQKKNEGEFFSLARIYCTRANEVLRLRNLTASSSFELPPYWSSTYLSHKRFTLGLPVSRSGQQGEDFVLPMEASQASGKLTLEIDLGENRRHGWVKLYPALSSNGPRVPGYGFPGEIEMEFVSERKDGSYGKVRPFYKNATLPNPGDNLLRIPSRALSGRWLRIHMSDFPVYENQAVFALSEIEVSSESIQQAINRPVSITFENDVIDADSSMLVDGLAGGQSILPMDQWLQGLAAGKTIEKSLLQLEAEQGELEQRWSGLLKNTAIGGCLLFLVIIGSVLISSSRKRMRESLRLRRQITLDLHDDVGSRLSAMALAATYLRKVSTESKVQERSGKIERMAREMQAALIDVLWFTDNNTDSLRELVHRLSEIAQQALPPELLVLEQSPEKKIPSSPVNVMFKRDILLIFKEILNNASKYSEADEIRVRLLWSRPKLMIQVADNGKGFDVAAAKKRQRKRPQLGLNSMERRAQRLGAELLIHSQPGSGCQITLTVKI